MLAGLTFTVEQLEQITEHLDSCLPEEACGLVGGLGEQARLILPVENELHSPVRFFMRPIDQFKAMERIDAAGLELVGIFHSHPNGPAHPSATDVAEFFYPGTVVLIASRPGTGGDELTSELSQGLQFCNWRMRGFQIEAPQINEVKLSVFK